MKIVSTDGEPENQLHVVPYCKSEFTFHFVNQSGPEAQIRDRDRVKEHVEKLLPKFKDVMQEDEDKKR